MREIFEKNFIEFKKRLIFSNCIFVLIILLPFVISFKDIWTGAIPFWYDPARDFLLAWENIEKPRLIGPETGIPGIYYGPYWIWLISLGLLVSKDPRIVTILLLLIPYFFVFTVFLFQLTKKYGKIAFILAWYLFILNFKNYSTYLWNPHLAPLLLLLLIYFLIKSDLFRSEHGDTGKILASGIFLGLLLNFHMSFGTGIALASILYLLTIFLYQGVKFRNNICPAAVSFIKAMTIFFIGLAITYIPFLIFEIRHGFNQLKSLIDTFYGTVVYDSVVVGQTGIDRPEIGNYFLARAGDLLGMEGSYLELILFLILSFFLSQIASGRLKLKGEEKNLLLFTGLSGISVLLVYYSTNNPVWHYHFIGVEILFLLFLSVLIGRLKVLRNIFLVWVLVTVVLSGNSFVGSFNDDPLAIQSLSSKRKIVESIYEDAGKREFAVFAYSPAIYTYDFDYLFKWIGSRKSNQLPEEDISGMETIYLIIPQTEEYIELDFINYKTPNDEYKTTKEWLAKDGTLIVRRDEK